MKQTIKQLEWEPLFQAFRDAVEWRLDIAAKLARDYPDEVAAIDRVRQFIRARVAGEVAHVRLEDVLFTFGLVVGAVAE